MTPKKYAATISPRLIGDNNKRKFIREFAKWYDAPTGDKKLWLENMDDFFNKILPTLLLEIDWFQYEEIDDMVCGLYKSSLDVPVIISPLIGALKEKRLYYVTNDDYQSLALVDSIATRSFYSADALPLKTPIVGQIWTIEGVKQVEMAVGDLHALAKENVYDPHTNEHLFYSDIYYYDYLSIGGDENFDEEEVCKGKSYESIEKKYLVQKLFYKIFNIPLAGDIYNKYEEEIISKINGTITPFNVWKTFSEIIGEKLI